MIQRLSEKQCFNGTHVNFVSETLSFCKQLNGLTVPDQDTHLSVVFLDQVHNKHGNTHYNNLTWQ